MEVIIRRAKITVSKILFYGINAAGIVSGIKFTVFNQDHSIFIRQIIKFLFHISDNYDYLLYSRFLYLPYLSFYEYFAFNFN